MQADYTRLITPNRSLSRGGRLLLAALLVLPVFFCAGGVAEIGAWPVLPFAWLEIGLVALFFLKISLHDGNCEKLTMVGDHGVN